MARKKQKESASPEKREYKVTITSDAVVSTVYWLTATSPEAALRMATSGDYAPDSMDTISEVDRSADVDGVEMDLET